MHRKFYYVSKCNRLVQLVVQVQYHMNVIYSLWGGHTHRRTNVADKSNFKKPGACLQLVRAWFKNICYSCNMGMSGLLDMYTQSPRAELQLLSYSRKVWQEESLTNLVNERHFAKPKSAKSFHPVQIYLAIEKFAKVSYHQTFLLYGMCHGPFYWQALGSS